MNRPRKFYGWEKDGNFMVSLSPRADGRAANIYDTKAQAEHDAINSRTDRGGPKPSIEWENEGG